VRTLRAGLSFVLVALASASVFGSETIVVGTGEIASIRKFYEGSNDYHDVRTLEALQVCATGKLTVDKSRLYEPALKKLIAARGDEFYADANIWLGKNQDFPVDLFDLVLRSEDRSYAKRVALQILCEKIVAASRDSQGKLYPSGGGMASGGIGLLISKRIQKFDPDSDPKNDPDSDSPVPVNKKSCYFSAFFYHENDGGVCSPYLNENPAELHSLLVKHLKMSESDAHLLYEKIHKYAWSTIDELNAAGYRQGTCRVCTQFDVQQFIESLISQSLTVFTKGKKLFCPERSGRSIGSCDRADFESGVVIYSKISTFADADRRLNREWRRLKGQVGTDENWEPVLTTQRAWIRMKLALVKAGNEISRTNSEVLHAFLTEERAAQLAVLRQYFVDK